MPDDDDAVPLGTLLLPLAHDVAMVVDLDWGVWNQAQDRWLFRTDPTKSPRREAGFPREGWLLRVERNWTHVDLAPASTMTREVADLLQTAVMDELGRGWPELYDGDVFAGLLTPMPAYDDGSLAWAAGGTPTFRMGELGSHAVDNHYEL